MTTTKNGVLKPNPPSDIFLLDFFTETILKDEKDEGGDRHAPPEKHNDSVGL
jgi:hypothetical protein